MHNGSAPLGFNTEWVVKVLLGRILLAHSFRKSRNWEEWPYFC